MTQRPQFSVLIPTLNRAKVLPRALESVLAQTCTDFELIVLDDGSTDETASVVASYDDERVRYVRHERAGVSAARNAAAEAATGEVFVFLDSDDELLPHALERIAVARADHDWDVVLGARVMVSPDRARWRTVVPRKLAFVPGAFAIKADTFSAVGGYDAQLAFGENTAFGWRVREHLALTGAAPAVIEDRLVVVYTRAERDYDVAKYASARRILDGYGDALANSPLAEASPRKRRATYLAIAGVGAARFGNRREALALTTRAIVNDPWSLKRYRNLVKVLLLRPADPAESNAPSEAGDAVDTVEHSWTAVTPPEGGAANDVARLGETAAWLDARGARVAAVGYTGVRLDTRTGRLQWCDHADPGLQTVDALVRSDAMLLREDVLPAAGILQPSRSSPFAELDCFLRAREAGLGVLVDASLASAPTAQTDPDALPPKALRGFVRDHVWVMRVHASPMRALRVTLRYAFADPVRDLRSGRGAWFSRAVARGRGCIAAWRKA
jgi:glycosyltransferase involved in cell wall biosynthesis